MSKRAIVSSEPGPELLLALGDGACGALAAAGRPGAAPVRDELSCGPLPALERLVGSNDGIPKPVFCIIGFTGNCGTTCGIIGGGAC